MAARYALGLDFGSLSARALLVDAASGEEVATAVAAYRHGFIEDVLPLTGERLPPDWTLQTPRDYLEALAAIVQDVLARARAKATDIIGIGVDFTACTMLPVKQDGTPLCSLAPYAKDKHAYVKKWKHHAAQPQANRLNAVAAERGEDFLGRYGGKISSEWMAPKALQVLEEAPEIYAAADLFVEAGDWLVWQLTGNLRRNSCAAGYKALWNKRAGYPSPDFFAALDPRMRDFAQEKLAGDVYPIGDVAGTVTAETAASIGLAAGTPVAVANVDAHVAMPAVGITHPGQMLMIIGTSTCHIVLGETEKVVPGICGVVEDGVLPGFFGYEAGQSCVGDHFDWFVKHALPGDFLEEARSRGLNPHQLLRERAEKLAPGESGLLALDWWNGNRSVLVDADLTGLLIGATLATRPEEIYRALIEATAFGTRMIIETFENGGIRIDELYACGGIAEKDPFLMQIYADVSGRPIRVSASSQTVAFGSAMFGAVAAGEANGGYADIFAAARRMPRLRDKAYLPDAGRKAAYDNLYPEYAALHDWFGRGGNDVMKRLKALRLAARQNSGTRLED